ncbi:MAG TPA: hypothetical protein PLI05_01795 [Methanotrichaceae archaeon]|nr:hypothetical protein [Methanotrichaceae archaeon]HQF15785.1 hypothetical protein [Methanotrichaceae archaeon]HQI90541.1 hypothetical protein [Methanotrichaceae archaeon]
MSEIRDCAEMQLRVIEQSYSIKILNKEEIAQLISEKVADKRQVLRVCTSLNYWAATKNISGDAIIPVDLVTRIIEEL